MTINTAKKSLIGKRSFDKTNPMTNIADIKEDIREEKNVNKQNHDTTYDTLGQRRMAKEETKRLRVTLNSAETQLLLIEEIITQK